MGVMYYRYRDSENRYPALHPDPTLGYQMRNMQNPATTSVRTRFENLDALRGIAAVVVMVVHYDLVVWNGETVGTFIGHSASYLAVDFFILLSGFVLAHAYLSRPGFAFRPFVLRRLYRLWPLHALMLLVIAAWKLGTQGDISLTAFGLNLLLLHNLSIGGEELRILSYQFNLPSWSLSVELVVNLLVGAVFAVCAWPAHGGLTTEPRLASQGRGHSMLTALESGLLAISVTSAGLLFVYAGHLDVQNEALFGVLNEGVLRGLVTFPLGVVLYGLFACRQAALAQWVDRRPWLPVLLLALFLISFYTRGWTRLDFLWLGVYVALVPVMAVLGQGGHASSHQRLSLERLPWASRLWPGRWLPRLKWLGDLSFALYLVHFVVQRIFNDLLGQALGYWPGLVVVSMISLLIAVLAHHGFEKPVYAWLNQRTFGNRRPVSKLIHERFAGTRA